MAAIWMTARAEWRQRWRSFVVVAVLAGFAGGVALAALAASRRADTAFSRLMERQKTANVHVTTDEPPNAELLQQAARWPGVDVAMQQVILAVATAGSGMYPLRDAIAVAVPFTAGEVPADAPIIEGRLFDERRADELVVNEAMRDALGADIGDRFSLVSLTPQQFEGDRAAGVSPTPAGPTQDVTLVGVARSAEDVSDAPDPVLIVTPAYYERYGPAIARVEGFGLRVDEDRLPEIEDRVRSLFGEDAEIDPLEDFEARIEGGLAVEVNGLRAFAAVAAIAGVVALGQALVRQADAMAEQHHVRRALGMTSRQLLTSGVTAALPVAAGGALLAAVGGVAGGPLAISGLARQAEPDPGPWLDQILVPGAMVVGLVVLTIAAAASWLVAARGPAGARTPPVRPSRGTGVLYGLPPTVSIGARMALDTGRGPTALPSRPALVGAAVGIAGVVAALTFGMRVDHLVATPELWGADYDAVVTTGEGAPDDDERAAEVIAGMPDVAAAARFDSMDLTIHAGDRELEDEAVTLWVRRGTISPVVIEGRAPAAPDEVALGAEVLDRLGIDVGDTVEVDRDDEKLALRVVGRHLQPAEDNSGSGIYLVPQAFQALEGEHDDSGVLVRFQPHVDVVTALDRLREVGDQVEVTAATEDAPSNVDNLDELGGLPWALAAFLAVLAAIAAHALVSTTRRRRRDLAVLRVLGFIGGQLCSALRWQALTVAAVGLVVGVPAGLIAGRRIWSALAETVGVVDDWSFPWLTVVLAVPAAMSVAALLAIPPGRAAARMSPGGVLRAE